MLKFITTFAVLNCQTFIPAKNNGLEDVLHGASVALNFAPTMHCTLLQNVKEIFKKKTELHAMSRQSFDCVIMTCIFYFFEN